MIKGDDWDAATVLDHGLPPLPAVLVADDEVPVASWQRGAVGAVLSIIFDPNDPEEPFSQDVEIRVRDKDGVWKWHSTSGSDWPFPYGKRPAGGLPVLSRFTAGAPSPDNEDGIWIASGIAPVGVGEGSPQSGAPHRSQ